MRSLLSRARATTNDVVKQLSIEVSEAARKSAAAREVTERADAAKALAEIDGTQATEFQSQDS